MKTVPTPTNFPTAVLRRRTPFSDDHGKEARREARRARARVLLARLMPYEKWVAALPPLMFPTGPWETPREAYDGLVNAIERQIADPCPISIEIKRDSAVVYDW